MTWEDWGIFCSACYAVGGWRNLWPMNGLRCRWPYRLNIRETFALRDEPEVIRVEYVDRTGR